MKSESHSRARSSLIPHHLDRSRLRRQQGHHRTANPGHTTAAADDRNEAVLRRAHGRHEKSARAEHRRRQQSHRRHRRAASFVNKQQQDRAGQVDQISGQIQALNDTMDELKVRLAKLSKQFEDMQARSSPWPRSSRKRSSKPRPSRSASARRALQQCPARLQRRQQRSGNAGIQRLHQVLSQHRSGRKFIFYLAEIQYKAGDYQKAVTNYDLVLQNFPSGNKAAAAQLKKGFALIELGKQDEGTQELKHVIQRYPRTTEATQARDRLRRLTPTVQKNR
jgi:tetratricopeptide (TPR) repeat protein